MADKSFKDSFKQGLGGELGKRAAGVIAAIIVGIGLLVWVFISGNSNAGETSSIPQINKANSQPNNTP
jgi:cytoskeletal protein RodZ